MRRVLACPMFLLLALIASIALVAAPGVRAAPQPNAVRDIAAVPPAFSTPVRVARGSFEDISEVVDSTNHVHIAAVDGAGAAWYITNRNGAWSSHKILRKPATGWYRGPLIAIDEHDRVSIAVTKWLDQGCASGGIFYVTDKGRARGTFPSAVTQIAPAGRVGTSLKVATGHLYLAMDDAACAGGPMPSVRFRTNASGAWATATLGKGDQSSMRLATNGHARIAYAGATGLEYAVAATTSGSFSTTKIPSTTGKDDGPILSLDPHGYSAAAWWHATATGWTVRYSTRKSGSWSTPATVATSSDGFDAVAFDMDTLGRPNIVLANTGDEMLRDLRLAGGTWTSSAIAGPDVFYSVSVRRSFSGSVVVAWVTDSGIYVSKG